MKQRPEKKQRILILTTTILASGLGFLMNSAVNIALPSIQEALAVELRTIQWIANAFSLALASLILLSGALGDTLGKKRVYNAGILLFSVGALACGLAPEPRFLIAARAVQGIGAAFMVPGSLAIINETFPEDERGKVIGLWAGVSGAVAALGPLVGGVLASLSWRWVFLAIVPLGLLTYFVSWKSVPELAPEKQREIDWSGIVLVVVALGGLSFGLIRLPETGFTVQTIIALGAAALAIPLFLINESRAEAPLVPFTLFEGSVGGANLATLLIYFAFSSVFFLLSFNLQQLQGYSSTLAGLAILPATLLITVLSAPSGSVTDRFGPRLQVIAGPLFMAVGLSLLLLLPDFTSGYAASFLPGILLLGVGMVTLIPAITKSALDVRTELSGTASGLNNAAARLAGLLAITIEGTILNAAYRMRLATELPPAVNPGARSTIMARSGSLLAARMPEALESELVAPVETAMRSAFAQAFDIAIAVPIAAAVAAAVIAAGTIRPAGSQRK
jgi:EmrB/QacA subfamily drug resistance transporter